MPEAAKNLAVVLLSHLDDAGIRRHFRKLAAEAPANADVHFLCDNSNGVFDRGRPHAGQLKFTTADLQSLRYPGKTGTQYPDDKRSENPHHKNFNFQPGSADLPILHFYRTYPNYSHYWLIEYDVRFSGSWSDFFAGFAQSDADLLGTTLTRYADIPDWYHWDGLDPAIPEITRDDYIRGFFPIYRLSNSALAYLHDCYEKGARGHQECLVPTLLNHAGFELEDLGGAGEFVRPQNKERFYRNSPTTDDLSPGSFVFRPARSRPGKEPDLLWHPVKNANIARKIIRRLFGAAK